MSIASVVTAAPSQNLTTVDTVVGEMGMTCSPAELRTLDRKIASVSAQISAYCHRVFGEERVIMDLKGYGSTQLLLERFPIVEVHSVAFDGEAFTDYTINERGDGTLFRRSGWSWTTGHWGGQFEGGAARAVHPQPNTEEALYQVNVTAGWQLPSFPASFVPNANSVLLPADVEAAALITIKDAFASRAGSTTQTPGQIASVATTGLRIGYAVRAASALATQARLSTGLPTDAVALLQPYVMIK